VAVLSVDSALVCIRARLQPCRTGAIKNGAFSPCCLNALSVTKPAIHAMRDSLQHQTTVPRKAGRLVVARRFNGGKRLKINHSPRKGTAEKSRDFNPAPRGIQKNPNVETRHCRVCTQALTMPQQACSC
jgi:hypothetical protein